MKIKPIALAIPMVLAAGSLSAAEIYNKDNNAVELSGWAKASGDILSTDAKKVVEEEDKEIEKPIDEKGFHVVTDANLSVKATHTIDEEAKVIGSFALNAGDSTDNNASFGDIKVEYDHTTLGNISLGDTGNSFGVVGKANFGEGHKLYQIEQGGVEGQGVRYKKTSGDLEFSANYETDSATSYESNYAASLDYKTDDYSLAVAYGSDGDKASSVGIAGDITHDDIKLAVAFISFEDAQSMKVTPGYEVSLGKPNDGHSYSLAAQYTVNEDLKLYVSYQAAEGDLQGVDVEANTYYAGMGYDLTKSINSYLVVQKGTAKVGSAAEQDATCIKFGAKYSF